MVFINSELSKFNVAPERLEEIKPSFFNKCEVCKKRKADLRIQQCFYDGWFNYYYKYFHRICLSKVG